MCSRARAKAVQPGRVPLKHEQRPWTPAPPSFAPPAPRQTPSRCSSAEAEAPAASAPSPPLSHFAPVWFWAGLLDRLPVQMDQEQYEQLVRRQLTEFGYDGDQISDDVLAEFLRDFEQKMELGNARLDSADESDACDDVEPLSYPTAIAASETVSHRRPEYAESKPLKSARGARASRLTRELGGGNSAPTSPGCKQGRAAAQRRVGGAASRSLAGSEGSAAFEPSPQLQLRGQRVPLRTTVRCGRSARHPVLGEVDEAECRLPHPNAENIPVANASRARPSPARGSDAAHLRQRGITVPSSSVLQFGTGYSASRIHHVKATPLRPKSDPVALHAQRAAGWKKDTFLSQSPRRVVSVCSPPPATQQRSRRCTPSQFVVPTSKRRDDVVWETRMKMLQISAPALSRRPSTTLVPNTFVPPTDKRRDDLRWRVRAEMAWTR